MASALMARVWIVVILAQHNNAESHRCARGRSADQDELCGGSEKPFRSVTDDRKHRRLPALVRNLLTDFITKKGGAVRQWKTSSAPLMDIPKLPDRDSGLELSFMDDTGRLCPKSAACSPTLSNNVRKNHVRRALEEPDFLELWTFDETPVEPFDSELIETTTQTTTVAEPAEPTIVVTDSFEETDSDFDLDQFLGLGEIPEEPFTGVDIETPPTPPTTTTTTTSATGGPVLPTIPTVIDSDSEFNIFWGLEEIPEEPFTGVDIETPPPPTTTTSATGGPVLPTIPTVIDSDSEFNIFWGLEEIPEEPFTGVDIETPPPPTTTTSATATTPAPATTTTTSVPVTTATTLAPATTATTTPAPVTTPTTPAPVTTPTTPAPATTATTPAPATTATTPAPATTATTPAPASSTTTTTSAPVTTTPAGSTTTPEGSTTMPVGSTTLGGFTTTPEGWTTTHAGSYTTTPAGSTTMANGG
nr:PREDICTED: mucin-2-like [Paralichthys olivaceus]